MLIRAIVESRLNVRKLRQVPILDIGEVLAQRRNVARIKTSAVDVHRRRRARPTVHIFRRVGEVAEGRGRERIIRVNIGVINLPRDPRAIELLKDRLPTKLRQVVIRSRIVHQPLRSSAGHYRDPIRHRLAGNRRKPAVRNRELRRHVVVVIQETLIVVPHGALARSVPVAKRLRITLSSVHKAIHQDRTRSGKVEAVHISITLNPRGRHVISTRRPQLKKRERRPFVVHVGDRPELVVNAIDVILLPVVPDAEPTRLSIRIQHPKVVVEAAVLLQHEDDVADGCSASSAARYGPSAHLLPARHRLSFVLRKSVEVFRSSERRSEGHADIERQCVTRARHRRV